ncbi:nascent polypeptide-associated complex protein [Candidatus Woesearchaeota archaeon]|nr:nascent polypeptide-associated complex protein [Candidatus Woesearchaeota archaeon]
MIPGINSRQAAHMMRRMGIQQQEIEATEVIIRTRENEIIIKNPAVSKINMMGQKTYQVSGDEEIRSLSTAPEISDEDVETVMEQAQVDKSTALKAIEDHNLDLAEAIMSLKKP